MGKVSVFLPCRKGSQRVLNKNTRQFAGFEHGLVEIKIKQLLEVRRIKKIYISSDDDDIIKYVSKIGSQKIILHEREAALSTSNTSTDQLVAHALNLIQEGEILWTHVTSPFLCSAKYDQIIEKYFEILNCGYDSLMTACTIQSFLWSPSGPINYNRDEEKWPRTQTLQPIHEINSGAFMASAKIYQKYSDRIGLKPYLYPLEKVQGFDIDWIDDFRMAQAFVEAGLAKL